jgi:hypothetical protein
MADSVKVIAQLAFIPASTSLAAATVRQSLTTQYTLANNGTLQTQAYTIVAGSPATIVIPSSVQMVLFVIDDAVNPQPITFSGAFGGLVGPNMTQSQQIQATTPYLGPWFPTGANTTITNNGTGNTRVRLFFWGN